MRDVDKLLHFCPRKLHPDELHRPTAQHMSCRMFHRKSRSKMYTDVHRPGVLDDYLSMARSIAAVFSSYPEDGQVEHFNRTREHDVIGTAEAQR